jgi:precorrin-3B synthase
MRIVPARDGGLCRVRLALGELSAAQARAVADAAAEFGSGVIEVTNRANLQLRGVSEASQEALIDCLLAAGLGPTTPGADDLRNLLLSPLAGLDAQAILDVEALARALLDQMQRDVRLRALSPKFSMLLDGGERLAMLDHPHDLWLAAVSPQRIAFGLAGCPPSRENDTPALAAVTPEHVPALVNAILHTFLDLASPEHPRMRDLLATRPVEDFMSSLQNRLEFALMQEDAIHAWRRQKADSRLRLGTHEQNAAGTMYIGAQPRLGRLDAHTLRALAHLAPRLRMTPWQGVMLLDVPSSQAASVQDHVAALDLATHADEPFARLIACAGSQGCAKGLADTKTDALQLAEHMPRQGDVHLSGCPRSCAASHPAGTTLLAVAPGRYDLYQSRTGEERAAGFGTLLAHHLTIQQAAQWLARSTTDA